MKQMQQIVECFVYQFADLKFILLNIESGVRGLGGVKQQFNLKNLPSVQRDKKQLIEQKQNQEQTEEMRLQRHKRFFEQMKKAYGPKKMTEKQKQAYIKKCQQPIVNDESKYDVDDQYFYN